MARGAACDLCRDPLRSGALVDLQVLNAPVVGADGRDQPRGVWVRSQSCREQTTGAEPLMIGLDPYNIASQLAFYGDGVMSSVGRGVLGQDSLMYAYWFQPEPLRGRPAVMFAFKRKQIDDPALANHFTALSDLKERVIIKDGKPAGRFYYRIGYEFRGADSGTSPAGASSLADATTTERKETKVDRAAAHNVER
jgi:hypothetical protein